jgi:hypothetical protein
MITTLVDQAHAQMEAIDNCANDCPLHIGHDEDPVEALKKIRAFLARNHSDLFVALAVAGLDRVLDNLGKFRVRRIFEEG